MNSLIQILKSLPVYLQNETLLKFLPFAGGGAAVAVVFFLLRNAMLKKTAASAPEEKNKREAEDTGEPPVKERTRESKNKTTDEKPLEKLRKSLLKSRNSVLSRLEEIVLNGKSDERIWEEFEELLVVADTGVKVAGKIRARVEKQLSGKDRRDYEKIKDALTKETEEILKKVSREKKRDTDNSAEKPEIIMVVGVNGTGKTTTAGKLARMFRSENKKIMLAAADTFRAAATEQLEQWARASESEFTKGDPKTDPSAVAFDAIKAGKAKNCDVVIVDTAGRLHTKTNLMDELAKIKKVIGKAHEGAPHEVFLVIDATTGQNAIRQVGMFHEAVGVTGIILTKLDGTAKGGILMAIAEEFKIPVMYIGTGEGIEDLAGFNPGHFTSALFD